jgi:hypothetical protein
VHPHSTHPRTERGGGRARGDVNAGRARTELRSGREREIDRTRLVHKATGVHLCSQSVKVFYAGKRSVGDEGRFFCTDE